MLQDCKDLLNEPADGIESADAAGAWSCFHICYWTTLPTLDVSQVKCYNFRSLTGGRKLWVLDLLLFSLWCRSGATHEHVQGSIFWFTHWFSPISVSNVHVWFWEIHLLFDRTSCTSMVALMVFLDLVSRRFSRSGLAKLPTQTPNTNWLLGLGALGCAELSACTASASRSVTSRLGAIGCWLDDRILKQWHT